MKCRKCGRRIRPGDKHCVYCGLATGPLSLRKVRGFVEIMPLWARWVGAFIILAGIGVIIAFTILNNHESTRPMWAPEAAPFQLKESSDAPISDVAVNSEYALSAPAIDGMLSPGEWPAPTFTKDFEYLIGHVSKTGDMNGYFTKVSKTGKMSGYFMNDEQNLYVAITVSADDFREDNFRLIEEEGFGFVPEVRFDGDSDGVISQGDDIRTMTPNCGESLNPKAIYYRNGSFDEESWWFYIDIYSGHNNGKGAVSFPTRSTGTYTYEFSIPLHSGSSNDLSVKPGDTIGIKVILREVQIAGGVMIPMILSDGP